MRSERSDGPEIIEVRTKGTSLVDITAAVSAAIARYGVAEGAATLFVQHTSCSLLIQENADPDVRRDLAEFFARLAPSLNDASMSWVRHRTEGPDDMPAHIRSALLPVSLSVPVSRGRLMLGTWQGVYLFEHRDAPHLRRVVVQVVGHAAPMNI